MIALITTVLDGPWSPQDGSDPDGFRDALETVEVMRRRIDLEVATGDDLRRFRTACSAVERIVRERRLPRLAVDASRLCHLLGCAETIYPPPSRGSRITEVADRLGRTAGPGHPVSALFNRAVDHDAGVVINVQPIDDGSAIEIPDLDRPSQGAVVARDAPRPDLADAIAALHGRRPVPFADDRYRSVQAVALREQIVEALRSGGVVPVGMTASHEVITEVLREVQDASVPTGSVRIVHVDGSEGAPFPVGHRPGVERSTGRAIRLGLMTVRHMDSDASVQAYWFRNRLVSATDRTLAETEAFCYGDTLRRLPELVAGGIGRIEMLHTGFEPAVIGFYRAVLTFREEHALTVVPRYPRRGSELAGVPWLDHGEAR